MGDNNIRTVHVSLGIYTRETEAQYSIKSLGITTLGVAGETLKGPAFQVMDISNWNEFKSVFGGTSTEKFKGSQYPKYELPYIAKSYLSESEQLKVVRVLGLSGYNAGPAWLVTASKGTTSEGGDHERKVVAVIRSRGHYNYYNNIETSSAHCQCDNAKFDILEYEVGETKDGISEGRTTCMSNPYNMNALQIKEYVPFKSMRKDCETYYTDSANTSWSVSQNDRGKFKLVGVKGKQDVDDIQDVIDNEDESRGYFEYAVSLNPSDSDYILNVLGQSAYDGETPIYVESLYDVALEQEIANLEVDKIDSGLTIFNAYKTADYCQHIPVDGIVTIPQDVLTRKMLGKRFLADKKAVDDGIRCAAYDYKTNEPMLIKDYFDDPKKQELIENDRPSGDFFEFKYRAPITTTMPDEKEYEYEGETDVYYQRDARSLSPYDVSGYTVTFLGKTVKVLTTSTNALPINEFKYDVRDGSGNLLDAPIVVIGNVGPSYNYGNPESGISAFTYEIKQVTKQYNRNEVGISPTATTKIIAPVDEHTYSEHTPITSAISTSYTTVYSSTTYTYGSQGKAVVPAETMGSRAIFLSGPTETVLYKTWSNQYADLEMQVGQTYTVKQFINADGKKSYLYGFYDANDVSASTVGSDANLVNAFGNLLSGGTSGNTEEGATLVFNNADGLYYKMNSATTKEDKDIEWVDLDLNDYKSAYRYASTPWIVSNLKGDYVNMEVNKLFRFHTISDGNNANNEVKISIENIRPDDGTFDVVVRKIDDLDESIIPLERFTQCTMIPTDANYIAYKIGSFDGNYEPQSKYITVEVNETTAAKTSVPCGFLGYPIYMYSGITIKDDSYDYGNKCSNVSGRTNLQFPTIKYNKDFDEDIKNRKQYFGLSSLVGVDIDNFTFKGVKTYNNDPHHLSKGFHLDSRLNEASRTGAYSGYTVTVDGENGYEFDAVSTNARTQILDNPPIIGKESEMEGSIYEYVNLRKFTVFFYGGFDGWDVYRDERSNSDNFKMTQYRGYINEESGEGYSFSKIQNSDLLGLNQKGITSDWYAYLAAIRQFSNPEQTDINVFATPGIDYVNQKLLVEETIDMIEEERADSIYVVTTPDKPSGSGDYADEMYTPEDVVYNLEDTEIDSNYTCTYYPWVKYLDVENNQYIYLPATKDAVRNFAKTDNETQVWYAPAGIERGSVDCVKAHFITKLADEDILHEGRINPIKTFAQGNVNIWGQKNLQIHESKLDRIAVRRLLLRMRKLIAISCIGLIFEPNDGTAKQTFISTVSSILDAIRSKKGISDYRIEVDDNQESRERRELPCKIFFKPYDVLEYLLIDFVLTPEGIDFNDI